MRKYLDIPLTLVVTTALTVAMLWPLEAPPPVPEGADKLVHFIAFVALAFPLARTGRFGLLPQFLLVRAPLAPLLSRYSPPSTAAQT